MTTWDFSENPENVTQYKVGDLAWIGNETTTLTLYVLTGFDGRQALFERHYPVRFKTRPVVSSENDRGSDSG